MSLYPTKLSAAVSDQSGNLVTQARPWLRQHLRTGARGDLATLCAYDGIRSKATRPTTAVSSAAPAYSSQTIEISNPRPVAPVFVLGAGRNAGERVIVSVKAERWRHLSLGR